MSIFNRKPKTITLENQKSVLQGRRSPVTGQAVLMTETDAEAYRKFLAEFAESLKPDGTMEIQIARIIAQSIWQIHRIHAIEENIFALGHSEKFPDMKTSHPEIHAAMVQALTFRNEPKHLAYIANYELKVTKVLQINLNILLKLQSLRRPVLAKEKTMTAAAA